MTIFEWCNRHPNDQMIFRYGSDGDIHFYGNFHNDDIDKIDDKELLIQIKDILTHNRNITLIISSHRDMYAITFAVEATGMPRLTHRTYVTRGEADNNRFMLLIIFEDTVARFSNMILGRNPSE